MEFPRRHESTANTLSKTLETEILYTHLTSLGNYYPLSHFLRPSHIAECLEPFESNWTIYNPNKPDYKRWGLSVTSLDGGLSGMPDLTSLFEYNQVHGTHLNELSFRHLTPVYDAVPEIHKLMEPLRPFLGRCHFLRFGVGGFFPYHRDSAAVGDDAFRIFVPLTIHSPRDFVFLLGPHRIEMENGRPYFINTRMEHALFSFSEPSLHLVLNVKVCRESVAVLESMLFSY